MLELEAFLEGVRIIPTADPQGENCNLLIGSVDEPGRIWYRNTEGLFCVRNMSFYLL